MGRLSLKHKKCNRKLGRTSYPREATTSDPYMKLMVKLYRFLDRRAPSKFNRRVLRRLCTTHRNRHPVSISKLAKVQANMRTIGTKDDPNKKVNAHDTLVVVSKVVNDPRLYFVPEGLRIAALGFSSTARARIEAKGGKCLTLEQVAQERPRGDNCALIRASMKGLAKRKHFWGVRGRKATPHVAKWNITVKEGARGRRKGKGGKMTTGKANYPVSRK
mmetsp:Transcript_28438/g.31589  ORF Transcript_28438/g.31589 Transcript_28438/m.31589 type:complete len:218 (+) Transcript_28438:70-723(+)